MELAISALTILALAIKTWLIDALVWIIVLVVDRWLIVAVVLLVGLDVARDVVVVVLLWIDRVPRGVSTRFLEQLLHRTSMPFAGVAVLPGSHQLGQRRSANHALPIVGHPDNIRSELFKPSVHLVQFASVLSCVTFLILQILRRFL